MDDAQKFSIGYALKNLQNKNKKQSYIYDTDMLDVVSNNQALLNKLYYQHLAYMLMSNWNIKLGTTKIT